MLTQGEDLEAHALRERGWSISAIARHLGRDRKTVRGYLTGARQPGVRRSSAPDPLAVVEPTSEEPVVDLRQRRFHDGAVVVGRPHLKLGSYTTATTTQ